MTLLCNACAPVSSQLRRVGDRCPCGQELIELYRWVAPSGRAVVVPVEKRGNRTGSVDTDRHAPLR